MAIKNWTLSEVTSGLSGSDIRYLEFLRVPSMSMGVYKLTAGSADPQQPHREDEVYFVLAGKAKIQVADEHLDVETGSVVFVGKEVFHRFHSIEDDLEVLVFFSPAETV